VTLQRTAGSLDQSAKNQISVAATKGKSSAWELKKIFKCKSTEDDDEWQGKYGPMAGLQSVAHKIAAAASMNAMISP